MQYKIKDLRTNEDAMKEKELCKLADEIVLQALVNSSVPDNQVGAFIKKYSHTFKGIENLKAHHFDTGAISRAKKKYPDWIP